MLCINFIICGNIINVIKLIFDLQTINFKLFYAPNPPSPLDRISGPFYFKGDKDNLVIL